MDELEEHYDILVSCFLKECEKQFRFLEQEYALSYFSGLQIYQNGRQVLKPFNKDALLHPTFQAATLYKSDALSLDITYGDTNFCIEGHLFYQNIYRFEWNDLLLASQNSDDALPVYTGITNEADIIEAVDLMASTLKKHIADFIIPSNKVIECAQTARHKHIEETIRHYYAIEFERVKKLAAKSFLEKDYRRVVELYMPYRFDLGPVDKKKFEASRQKIHQQSS